jgi:hypothetical protein
LHLGRLALTFKGNFIFRVTQSFLLLQLPLEDDEEDEQELEDEEDEQDLHMIS